MSEFEVVIKQELIDGIGPWIWPAVDLQAQDGGLWEGPRNEWGRSKQLIQKYVTDFGCVVQAGGASGMYPRLMADMFDMVYTFEPHPLNFFCLNLNCQKSNIIKIQAGLGEYGGNISLVNSSPNMGMHQTVEFQDSVIPRLQIDAFEFKNLGLIYLDIERSEEGALKGAEHTIITHLPIIVCENGNDRIVEYLSQFGYSKVDQNVNDSFYKVIK
jgi:FkbM family methyltransferase